MKTSLICGLTTLLLSLTGLAHAQGGAAVDTTPLSPARSLSCLQQPAGKIKFPEQHELDHATGMMRVKLRFEKPDAKPIVEVLANTAREDMQDEVYRRVARYRLPCLTPQDGVVSAVQEFNFNNSDREPLPMEEEARPPLCIVMPREGIDMLDSRDREVQHVILAMVFDGDGAKPPELKIIYSSGSRDLERATMRYAKQYRMPCRSQGDEPRAARQRFTYRPNGMRMYGFKREGFGLGEFLGMTVGIRELQANFDLRTMNCPFKVNYEVLGPKLPNEVHAGGKEDPNRTAFMKWLAERQISFKNDDQAKDLFGATLQINVPCGVLKLEPKTAAATLPAMSPMSPAASALAGG